MSLSINVDVPDSETGERFYIAAVGLTVGRRYGKDFVELFGQGSPVCLLATNAGAFAAGATLEAPAKDAPYGRIAMLADPFGHGFCLLQLSARGYDALLGG